MFQNVAFGSFENVAFGSFGAADSASILVNFQYIAEPESKSESYEKQMLAVTQAALNYMVAAPKGGAPLRNAGEISRAIRGYSNYWRMRYQNENGATTPQATGYVYENVFGGFSNYVKLMKFLDDQQKEAAKERAGVANIQLMTVHQAVEDAKNSFFADKLYPLARDGKLSQDDAMFLADIFQDRTYGSVSADELNEALRKVAPFLSPADVATVMMFAPKLVLGLDLGSDSLHSDAGIPTEAQKLAEAQKVLADPKYQPRAVNPLPAQVADIKNKYSEIRSRLGSFADPGMDSTFQAFINVVAQDSMDFKGSDLTLYQMYINSVGRAVTSAFGIGFDSPAQQNQTIANASEIANQIIARMKTDPNYKPSADEVQQMLSKDAGTYVESNWSGGGALTMIALGAAIWYFVAKRK